MGILLFRQVNFISDQEILSQPAGFFEKVFTRDAGPFREGLTLYFQGI